MSAEEFNIYFKNVPDFIRAWLENINDNQTTGIYLLDISKCFYTISLHILLHKLNMYGIKHTELGCFSSYFGKHKEAVLCHNILSS